MYLSNKKQDELLRAQLTNERSSFISHWRDLNDYILPRRGRFYTTDVNKGDRRNLKIIDSTGTLAARTLRSGMMSGVTSPARPWFRLTTPDPGLAEFNSVKIWLHTVSQRMTNTYLRSNLYNVLPTIYSDLGVFATGAMLIEEDVNEVIRNYPLPIGSYMISNNAFLRVDTFFRELPMTVRQIVERFGFNKEKNKIEWENISTHVKTLWDAGQKESVIEVCHRIKPNDNWDQRKAESKFKRYSSVYYEKGSASSASNYLTAKDEMIYLSEKGYDYFPVLCPRWEVTGEDAYGTDCPGMAALGDIKALQHGEKKAARAIDKMIDPPLKGHANLRNEKISVLPGDLSYGEALNEVESLRPIHEVDFNLGALENKQAQMRQRVQRAFYEDLFLMLANSDRRQITAREIDERHEEKLLALGPVLEQLNQDLLDPLIEITFNIMLQQSMDATGKLIGAIPEPPKELEGIPLKVEYISIMAQAQKLVGLSGIERFTSYAGNIIQANPEALDKIDTDQILDVYGDLTSLPPGIVRTDDDVAKIRANRAQAQQAQAQQEQMQNAAMTAKNLSQAQTSGDNALAELMSQGGGI